MKSRSAFSRRYSALAILCMAFGVMVANAQPSALNPSTLPKVSVVDERFQSYNIEMVEVTGGRFWKPYASGASAESANGNQPIGMDPSLYEYRKPIDLHNERLRKLASALGPAYVRVSGTWANTTYFQSSNEPVSANPPPGFNGVLTRDQWRGVVDFSKATDAKIVTSFAISQGARDASGVWTPGQAKEILDYTKSLGGSIAAAELFNEPTMPEIGGAPKGYDAAAFSRDIHAFRSFARSVDPKMILLGPGGVGEGPDSVLLASSPKKLKSEDMLTAAGPAFDAFSYHSYAAVSSRCKSMSADATTTEDAALSLAWLARGGQSATYYANLRDRYEPGKPLWNTETAQAACGGDRWASTFLDSFRYLNQLGELAKHGVQVQLHNTLAASDYGLLQEHTFEPRPNYWSALLWRKLMGTTVLDAGASPSTDLHLFAHCLRNRPGGVAVLAINSSQTQAQSLAISAPSERYTLTAAQLTDRVVRLNGVLLKLGVDDSLPEMQSQPVHAGTLTFSPKSISFLAMPNANNPACGQ